MAIINCFLFSILVKTGKEGSRYYSIFCRSMIFPLKIGSKSFVSKSLNIFF